MYLDSSVEFRFIWVFERGLVIRKTLLEGCRSHVNIFFGTTLLTNLDFRFVYDAFYLAILLEWTIVGVSAVTVIINCRSLLVL
jgi:hypothetical protein